MIHAHSLGRARRYYPEAKALASVETSFNFRQLHDHVENIAGALSEHGFRAGDRLALLLPNETDYLELIYACAWLGVIIVPLNTRLSATEIDHILSDASPRGLIRHSTLAVPTVPVPQQLVLDQQPLNIANSNSAPDPIYDPDAVFALIYTSGTTGLPKGVALTHANILADVDHVNYWLPYKERGVYLHAAPLFHIADFPFTFASPAFGTCQVTIPKFSPQAFCETVARERATHTVLVPTMINELLQVYGLTETGFLSGLQDHEHIEGRLESCGRPCPGIELRVVDDSGKEVEQGRPGELVTRGANVMHGYWNNPKESSLPFSDGFFRTGDIGYQDAEGYFYILDRKKDMIVSGGENVYSGEVEAVISQHPAVREVAVFGIPDPKWGELVMACVVLKPGNSLTADQLIAYSRKSLASYKIPRAIEFSKMDLPKSGSGKILKKTLRERFWVDHERAVG